MAGADSRFVHHMEHHGQALRKAFGIGSRTKQNAAAVIVIAEIEQCCRLCVQPHFVFDADGDDVIRFIQRAVIIDPDFGNDIKSDARRTRRSFFGTRQHQMDCILTCSLISGSDEHFGSFDFPDAGVIRGIGAGDNITGVRAEVRFGEAHGSLPVTVEHFGDKHIIFFLCAKTQDKIGGAAG